MPCGTGLLTSGAWGPGGEDTAADRLMGLLDSVRSPARLCRLTLLRKPAFSRGTWRHTPTSEASLVATEASRAGAAGSVSTETQGEVGPVRLQTQGPSKSLVSKHLVVFLV